MTRIFPLLLALPIATAFADTIKLKSGDIVQGQVLSSDSKSITIEVHYSPTIVDDEVIARSDIANFSVEAPDEVAYQKLGVVQTPDTMLTPDAGQALIDNQLQPFVTAFPSSPRAADVQKQIKAIQADRARLKAGDLKISGIWYDHASLAAEKYQVTAATIVEGMKQQMAASNFPAVLNTFDLLKRTYPGSTAYAAAVPMALTAVAKFEQQLNFEIGNLPETIAARKAAIDRTPIEDQMPIKESQAEDSARAAAAQLLAQKNSQRFFTLYDFDDKGLHLMQTSLRDTQKTLLAIDTAALTQGAALARQATQELNEHELAAAATTLDQLSTTWPQYEALPRLEMKLKTANEAEVAAAAPKKPAKPAKPGH